MEAPEGKVEVLRLKREAEQLLAITELALAKAAGEREALVHQVGEAERKIDFLTDELQRLSRQAGSKRAELAEIRGFARRVRQRLARWIRRGGQRHADTPVPGSFRSGGVHSDAGCTSGSSVISLAESPVFRHPVDFHRLTASGVLMPGFEPIQVDRRIPSGYPFDLVLPQPIGNKNDFGFLMEAINQLGCMGDMPARTLGVIAWVRSRADLDRLADGLASQTLSRDRFTVTAFVDAEEVAHPVAWADQTFKGCPWRDARQEEVWLKENKADVIVFLDGWGCLDCHALERVARYASVSIPMVIGLLVDESLGKEVADPGVHAGRIVRDWRRARYPFNKLQDFNFAVGRSFLEDIGGFDPRFQGVRKSVMELCYRAYNNGAYFLPLPAAKYASTQSPRSWGWEAEISDDHLFQTLCPVSWYRKEDGKYQVPKVSIYIPAYNAEEFICDAINSALDQDFKDLEVCIHVDGASDGTLGVLEKNYAGNPRVRWSAGANAGIGHASNRAIGLTRGMYIGQLDADDRLKPGAVRRLAEFLDDYADIGCVYSSSERIDRDGHYLRDEYNWPSFSREKMMLMSIAHHFRMFRRQAWQRTEKFREDISNAVDYDMFLKLSDVTGFHHVDEKLYERRWHGGNTSYVNEDQQTRNTHIAQTMALERQGLSAGWQVSVPDRSRPRKVRYTRKAGRKRVVFWPDCTSQGPYQRLLYRGDVQKCDFISGDIAVALRLAREAADPENVFFHLHSPVPLLQGVQDEVEARQALDCFLESVSELQGLGGSVFWTLHGFVTAGSRFPLIEQQFATALAATVDKVHVHSQCLVSEIERHFQILPSRVFVTPHGGYQGIYPDFVSREGARQLLGLPGSDVTILCCGGMYPSEGLGSLLRACEKLVRGGHPVRLVLAGESGYDAAMEIDLFETLTNRVLLLDRRIEDAELQVLFRAADVAVIPSQISLVPNALMLSFSFGLPVVAPSDAVTRELLRGLDAGFLYGPEEASAALEDGLSSVVEAMDQGRWEEHRANARTIAEDARWPAFMAGIASADSASC